MQLPVKAKIKLTLLTDAEQSARDNVSSVMRRLSGLESAIGTAPTSEHDSIEQEISRLRGKLDEAQRKYRAAADMNARLGHFLDTMSKVALADAKTKPAKIEKGETLALAAARIRSKIFALTAERRKVDRCGLPIAEAKKQAEAYVAELVERGRPKVLFGHDRGFSASFNATIDGAYTVRQDVGAMLAWLDAPALLKRLFAEIEAQPELPMALTAKARSEKLAALNAELLVLEFEDEACVEASEIEGPFVLRREDADPRAVLGVTIDRGTSAATKPARIRADASERAS